MKTAREILDNLIRRGMKPSEQERYAECVEKDVNQALADLDTFYKEKFKKELMEKLPKKKNLTYEIANEIINKIRQGDGQDNIWIEGEVYGYNQALEEILTTVKDV